MKNWKKIAIIAGVIVAVLAIVGFTVSQSRKNVATVQTAKAADQDLASIVSASGEVKPKNFVNVGANAYGKIVRLFVKEGDSVKQGQVLAQLENVQPQADVASTRALLRASQGDAVALAAALKTSQADLLRARADEERTRLDFERAQGLFKEMLIAKAEYDTRKAAFDSAAAGLEQARARVAQASAQLDAATDRIKQANAQLTRASDVLSKTTYVAPYDGIVTNLPVREGEMMVMGIQNAPGSTLMTISDMAVVTAEVKVDETDIVNVRLGQPAEVTIDAIPRKVFKGKVTEIGNNAVIRSTGLSTSQSTAGSQEAKDFKVVVTLDDPPQNLRPGLSTTAKITTAKKNAVLTIPIQALTVRQRGDLEEKKKDGKGAVEAASKPLPAAKEKEEVQGVFVVRNRKAVFVPVETGITGTTDIEITGGLKPGDEVVTGSYKVLRTLRNQSGVKVDNSSPTKTEESS